MMRNDTLDWLYQRALMRKRRHSTSTQSASQRSPGYVFAAVGSVLSSAEMDYALRTCERVGEALLGSAAKFLLSEIFVPFDLLLSDLSFFWGVILNS